MIRQNRSVSVRYTPFSHNFDVHVAYYLNIMCGNIIFFQLHFSGGFGQIQRPALDHMIAQPNKSKHNVKLRFENILDNNL